MVKNKTIETENSVAEYLSRIADEKKRNDCSAIMDLITKQTGLVAKMWGTGIVGFGNYHYKYESGHEGNAPLVGIAARVNAITLYLSIDFEQKEELLKKFGKHKSGKGCIYIQKLEDIDINIFTEMVHNSIEHIKSMYPS